MSKVSVSEVRATLFEVLDRVAAGEEVTITRHGNGVAVVVRPDTLPVCRADRAIAAASAVAKRRADALVRQVDATRSAR
jgi:antitoxin (DNA-binding transcriptional repressor) of toxin-antitoxin stability system